MTQAPGANQETKLGGLSIDGASAGENRYIIDGIETTNLQNGTSGKNVIVDFIEEVQVKSSGYTAEFGGATGGVINAVTKSGTNDFHGSALYNFEGSSLEGARRPTLRQNLTNSDVAEYVDYPKDDRTRSEPGFAHRRPDREEPRVVLRRLSAGADQHRPRGQSRPRPRTRRPARSTRTRRRRISTSPVTSRRR